MADKTVSLVANDGSGVPVLYKDNGDGTFTPASSVQTFPRLGRDSGGTIQDRIGLLPSEAKVYTPTDLNLNARSVNASAAVNSNVVSVSGYRYITLYVKTDFAFNINVNLAPINDANYAAVAAFKATTANTPLLISFQSGASHAEAVGAVGEYAVITLTNNNGAGAQTITWAYLVCLP